MPLENVSTETTASLEQPIQQRVEAPSAEIYWGERPRRGTRDSTDMLLQFYDDNDHLIGKISFNRETRKVEFEGDLDESAQALFERLTINVDNFMEMFDYCSAFAKERGLIHRQIDPSRFMPDSPPEADNNICHESETQTQVRVIPRNIDLIPGRAVEGINSERTTPEATEEVLEEDVVERDLDF